MLILSMHSRSCQDFDNHFTFEAIWISPPPGVARRPAKAFASRAPRNYRNLEDVIDLIDQMTWFYMCEFPDLSVRWARKALDAPDFTLPRENVSSSSASPSADVLHLSEAAYSSLLDMNQADLAIYSHALERFLTETRNASLGRSAMFVESRAGESSSGVKLALAS